MWFCFNCRSVYLFFFCAYLSVNCDSLPSCFQWGLLWFLSRQIAEGNVALVAMTGTIIPVPCCVVRSLQLIWRWNTRGFHFGCPILKWVSLTWVKIVHQDNSSSNDHQGDITYSWYSYTGYRICYTVEPPYNTVYYYMITHITWREVQSIDEIMNSQKTPHSSPSRMS